jgi:cytochrome c oxidase assembly protein subunit 15
MKMSAFEHGVIGFITLAIIIGAFMWIRHDAIRYRKLIAFTTVVTLCLIVLGAYVRLSDAGLGCPDWPGCYGNLTPAHSAAEIRATESAQPGGPVSMGKAWKEMVHRYLAMVVGALIAAIMFAAWRNRRRWAQPPLLPTVIAAAVVFQAALGAWTVTLLLKPAIVTCHLLGGIAILALLTWLLTRQQGVGKWAEGIMASAGVNMFALIALVVLFGQIVLGGWVSTNYAALACQDLPTCHGAWVPEMDFANAFHVIRPLGVGPTGELLRMEALTAIHWAHRVGAMVTLLVVGTFAWRLMKIHAAAKAAHMLMVLLGLQILLGLSNVFFSLPLAVAVGHNGVAAMLFAWMVVINLRLLKGTSY